MSRAAPRSASSDERRCPGTGRPAWVALWLAMTLLGACAGDARGGRERTELIVFAASSLTDAFEEIGARFERDHAGVATTFNFLASSDLALQIEQGAPADVFASADEESMARVVAARLASAPPRVFARNELAIAVPTSNPAGVRGIGDLADPDLVLSLCSAECPAGRYARTALAKAGVDAEPDSLEPDVRAVLTRVQSGEVDAGVVYATDVVAVGRGVEAVPIERRHNVIATYPIVAVKGSAGLARSFVAFALSSRGRRILGAHGFQLP